MLQSQDRRGAEIHDAVRLGAGIVTSLAHPGGNVTGTMFYGAELAGKRVDVFKEAVPAIEHIAVLGTTSPLTPARKQTIWARRQPGQTWKFLSRKNKRRRNRHKN
jgi:hypothetical protein